MLDDEEKKDEIIDPVITDIADDFISSETPTVITIKDVILASPYYDKVNCIYKVFEQVGVNDYWTLQEAPGLIRGHICNTDIYQLVSTLSKIYEDYDKEE